MPSFHSLGFCDQICVSYLRTLQGGGKSATLPGNPQKGKINFLCARAAVPIATLVGGKGGFLAPDLSSYARTRSADEDS